MEAEGWTTAGLWLAVVLSGLYHGASPGMGWPLAVSAGLMERRASAVAAALAPIAVGHLAAMALVLLPFAALAALAAWSREIRLAAGLLVAGFGLWRLLVPRHPRLIARIPPTRLALWSFAVAIAHGAGLLVLPVYLGLCAADAGGGHDAAGALAADGARVALLVALVHAAAMVAAAGAFAFAVWRWLGLRFISRSWFNLDRVWAAGLILAGGAGLATAL